MQQGGDAQAAVILYVQEKGVRIITSTCWAVITEPGLSRAVVVLVVAGLRDLRLI